LKIEVQKITIPTNKNHQLGATKFYSVKNSEHCMVISSATGVLQKYYSKFARFFASQGFTVYTFDYYGVGASSSSTASLKANKSNLKSWGQDDQSSIIAFAKNEQPNAKITLVTHSLGGQLLGFNPNYEMIDRALLVASQSGYWKLFKGHHRAKMWLFWHVLIPFLTPLAGYFPAKRLGLFENLPKQMVYEWATWGRRKDYFMHFENESEYFFDKIKIPILILSFSKDSFAPQETVDWLSEQYKNAKIKRVHHQPNTGEQHVKHFGFFKSGFQDPFWKQSLNWILNNTYN